MPAPRRAPKVAQAWVELRSADPAAQSAFQAVRAHLPEGRALRSLRRARLFELAGAVPGRARLEELVHRSSQFYNPHKEGCVVRRAAREPLPVEPRETTVVVWDRDGERRGAAEHWLAREIGKPVEVREATVWVLGWDEALSDAARLEATRGLSVVRDQRHGLLANPHAQEARALPGAPPLPAMTRA